MKQGLAFAAFGAGVSIGILAGILLAAPLLGWHLDDAASTVISAAVGAAAAVFGAVFYELWKERSRDRVRQWKQVLLIYPTVRRLMAKTADYTERLAAVSGTEVSPDYFELSIKVDVEPLAAMLTDVDALDRGLAQDLLNVVGWGRELDTLLELKVVRTAGVVSIWPDAANPGMRQLAEVVTACAKSASEELERLRLKFQDETVALERKTGKQ